MQKTNLQLSNRCRISTTCQNRRRRSTSWTGRTSTRSAITGRNRSWYYSRILKGRGRAATTRVWEVYSRSTAANRVMKIISACAVIVVPLKTPILKNEDLCLLFLTVLTLNFHVFYKLNASGWQEVGKNSVRTLELEVLGAQSND